jgi:hypothetical protein
VRPPRLVLAELKSEAGKVTEHQARWLALLHACPGVEVFLWRPSDLERIERQEVHQLRRGTDLTRRVRCSLGCRQPGACLSVSRARPSGARSPMSVHLSDGFREGAEAVTPAVPDLADADRPALALGEAEGFFLDLLPDDLLPLVGLLLRR